MPEQEYDNDADIPTIPQTLIAVSEQVDEISPNAPMEDVLGLHMHLELFAKALRYVKKQMEARMIQWINANGDIECGTVRYYVGPDKKVKPIDNPKILETLYMVLEGDEAAVCQCMSSSPWKYGGIRKLLEGCEGQIDAPPFDDLFATIEEDDLKTGKPKKKLQQADQRFLK